MSNSGVLPILSVLLIATVVATTVVATGPCREEKANIKQAKAQVASIAERLISHTHAGNLVREEIHDTDPWGNALQVHYGEGGFTESVTVASAGPDGEFGTPDDISRKRAIADFENAGRTASRGILRGFRDARENRN